MNSIKMKEQVGVFAENKEKARRIRLEEILPVLEKDESVTLDFSGVDATTQSFIHALISDLIRKYGSEVLERLLFKNCNETVQKIVTIVVDYMQESEF